jgi:Excalibur calcium-binding domain
MHKLKLITGLALAGMAFSAIPVMAAPANKYSNCTQLNSAFPNGVAGYKAAVNKGVGPISPPATNPSVYKLNLKLDADKDGIVCEVLRGVVGSNSEPTPKNSKPSKLPLATLPDSYQLAQADLSECQLKETANITGAGAKGFPIRNEIPAVGEVKIAIIPVDFSNAPGVGNPGKIFQDDLVKIKEWGKFFSRNKVTYQPQLVSKNWIRAPRGADWYVCAECGKSKVTQKQSRQAGLLELIKTADPYFDFAGTDFVYFVFPYKAEREFGTSVYSHLVNIQTNEGQIETTVYGEMGGFAMPATMVRDRIWDHLIHEILHFQGQIGHGPLNGTMWGIYPHQWGGYAPTAWEAFMSGWFGTDEILCLDATKLPPNALVTLSSIDTFGIGPEVVFVKLSNQELVAIEYRKNGKFTNLDKAAEIRNSTAMTAYRVDVNAEAYRNDSDPNGDTKNFWWYLRDEGRINILNSTIYKNLKITRSADNQVKLELMK